MSRKHVHKFVAAAVEIAGFVIASDQGVCRCGAFLKGPLKRPEPSR